MKILVNGALLCKQDFLINNPKYHPHVGWLQTPRNGLSYKTIQTLPFHTPIYADNSAFTGFDETLYLRFIDRIPTPDTLEWLSVPDIVGDAEATIDLFHSWQPRLDHLNLAFVAQDGAEDLQLPWDLFVCLFIGGTTDWKLSQAAADLCAEAKTQAKWLHMGRVNSKKRLRYAYALHCDSVDGTGYSKYSKKYLAPALEYVYQIHNQLKLF